MKLIYLLVCIFLQTMLYSQGTVLKEGESATLIGYSLTEIESGNQHLHSLFCGYSFSRMVDLGLVTGKLGDDRLIGGSISGYINSKPLNFRTSLLLSKKLDSNSEWNKGVNFTAFYLKSTPEANVTPSIGYTYAGTDRYFLIYGLELLLKTKNIGVVLGIDYSVSPENANSLTFSVGILFQQQRSSVTTNTI